MFSRRWLQVKYKAPSKLSKNRRMCRSSSPAVNPVCNKWKNLTFAPIFCETLKRDVRLHTVLNFDLYAAAMVCRVSADDVVNTSMISFSLVPVKEQLGMLFFGKRGRKVFLTKTREGVLDLVRGLFNVRWIFAGHSYGWSHESGIAGVV